MEASRGGGRTSLLSEPNTEGNRPAFLPPRLPDPRRSQGTPRFEHAPWSWQADQRSAGSPVQPSAASNLIAASSSSRSRAADVPTWNDLGQAGEGVVLSTPWHPALGYPGTEAVNQRHLEEVERPADPVVGSAYALLEILADAIERAGTLEHDAVRDAIAATDGLETIIGPITFRDDGTADVPNPHMQRVGGAIELIWPADAATADLVYPAP